MAEKCVFHVDHENRISALEEDVDSLKKEDVAMKERIGNPALWVALISFLGVCVTASASFAAVIFAPVIKAWLGVGQ